jgi:hypothetical protein
MSSWEPGIDVFTCNTSSRQVFEEDVVLSLMLCRQMVGLMFCEFCFFNMIDRGVVEKLIFEVQWR